MWLLYVLINVGAGWQLHTVEHTNETKCEAAKQKLDAKFGGPHIAWCAQK